MGWCESWTFTGESGFDGARHFAEINPADQRNFWTGTLEMIIRPSRFQRGAVVSHGVPGRDPGAFVISVSQLGAVGLTTTDRVGAPLRLVSAAGIFDPGDSLQVTLSWGEEGAISVLNLSRRDQPRSMRDISFFARLPHRARVSVRQARSLTFGSACGGFAPFYAGMIDEVRLSGEVMQPTIAPPSAEVHHVDFRGRKKIAPRRVGPVASTSSHRPPAE